MPKITSSHVSNLISLGVLHALCPADKPGSEEPHYHLQQEERVRVKQGKLGYFIGHQTHVQSAEAEEEVVVKPGEGTRGQAAANRGLA
jgi:hypothetical protein